MRFHVNDKYDSDNQKQTSMFYTLLIWWDKQKQTYRSFYFSSFKSIPLH